MYESLRGDEIMKGLWKNKKDEVEIIEGFGERILKVYFYA